MPNAFTAMRTHPGRGSGIGTSRRCRFSTGPGSLNTTARMPLPTRCRGTIFRGIHGRCSVTVMTQPDDRVQWRTDLVGLEIVLWDRVDARLRQKHDLPLAYFQALREIARAPEGALRIGDLAR